MDAVAVAMIFVKGEMFLESFRQNMLPNNALFKARGESFIKF